MTSSFVLKGDNSLGIDHDGENVIDFQGSRYELSIESEVILRPPTRTATNS